MKVWKRITECFPGGLYSCVLTLLILLLVLETGISAGLVNLAAETIWKTLPLQGAFVLQAVDDGGNSKAATPLSIYTILRHVVANEADVFAWNQNLAQLSLPEGIQLVNVLSASPNILHILKIKPALGRLLLDEDGINVALISSRLWREQLYADNAVVGKELLLNNKHVTVIGVLDSPFPALIAGFPPDIILSLPSGSTAESVANVPVHIIGRLRGTFLPKALEQTVNTSWSTIVAATVPVTSTLDRWHKVAGSGVRVLDGRYGVNRLRDIVSAPFNVIFLLGISLLLSTSATVSIIIIAFSSRRGIRPQSRPLGSAQIWDSRSAVLGTLAVMLLGTLLILAVAYAIAAYGLTLLPPSNLPRVIPIRMFSPVTIVSACALLAMIGLLTALPVCLWSIPRRYRADRPLLARKRRALRVLLSAQAAVAIFLLVCTGLFLHALSLLTSQDFGVRSKDLYLISLAGQRGSRDSLQDYDYFHQLIDRINHVSGVRRSALLDGVFFLPPGGMPTTVRSSSIGRDVQARLHCASPGLFMTLGTPILDGREFSISDGKGSPRVAIVNAELARILFGSSRLASRSIEMPAFTPALVQVVGVVANIKHGSMREATTPDLYIPCEQRWAAADLLDAASLVVQYRQGAGEHTRETVAALIETFGRQLPVKQAPLDGLLRGSLSSERFLAILGLLFAAIALCAFGLAILSSTVLLRTAPEFPSPFLLPKNSSQPVQLSRRHVLLPLLPGAALGVLGALLLLYSHHAGTIFAGQATTCSACTVTPQGVSLAETYLFHPNRYITCVIVSIAVTLVFILAGVMTIIAGGASWLPSSPVRTRLDL